MGTVFPLIKGLRCLFCFGPLRCGAYERRCLKLNFDKNTLTGPANCKKTTRHQSPNQEFFSKIRLCHFLPLQSPKLMQKIRKILEAVSEKTALPTNQLLPTTPILYDLADAGPKIINYHSDIQSYIFQSYWLFSLFH